MNQLRLESPNLNHMGFFLPTRMRLTMQVGIDDRDG